MKAVQLDVLLQAVELIAPHLDQFRITFSWSAETYKFLTFFKFQEKLLEFEDDADICAPNVRLSLTLDNGVATINLYEAAHE